jgi:flavin reductase (DIM6/NTAB) family NADH-FMN oxidoreductase RutF
MLIDIQQLPLPQRQAWLQHAIAPRPICFASTIDANESVNLSPFSFFNLFSSNPPIVIAVPEVAINICDYDMVQQVSLSSCEYPKGVDEFIKAGFTKENATLIKPPMVAEAKVKMECKVIEVKSLGETAGAGQLVIAEVLCMHVHESILNADASMIDPLKFKQVARLGGDYYAVMNEQNLFTVAKPNKELGIGVDALPSSIKNSNILTGNNLGQLANVQELPIINPSFEDNTLKNIVQYYAINPLEMESELHTYAKQLLQQNKVQEAWQVLLVGDNM